MKTLRNLGLVGIIAASLILGSLTSCTYFADREWRRMKHWEQETYKAVKGKNVDFVETSDLVHYNGEETEKSYLIISYMPDSKLEFYLHFDEEDKRNHAEEMIKKGAALEDVYSLGTEGMSVFRRDKDYEPYTNVNIYEAFKKRKVDLIETFDMNNIHLGNYGLGCYIPESKLEFYLHFGEEDKRSHAEEMIKKGATLSDVYSLGIEGMSIFRRDKDYEPYKYIKIYESIKERKIGLSGGFQHGEFYGVRGYIPESKLEFHFHFDEEDKRNHVEEMIKKGASLEDVYSSSKPKEIFWDITNYTHQNKSK